MSDPLDESRPRQAKDVGHDPRCAGRLSADDPSITVPVQARGRLRDVDHCIAPLVAALNAGGVETFTSCCGHGLRPGSVALGDGRWLLIVPDDKAFDRAWEALLGC